MGYSSKKLLSRQIFLLVGNKWINQKKVQWSWFYIWEIQIRILNRRKLLGINLPKTFDLKSIFLQNSFNEKWILIYALISNSWWYMQRDRLNYFN